MDLIRVQVVDEVLDLGDGDPGALGGLGIEVADGLLEDEVALAVGLVGVDQPEVGTDRGLKDVLLAVEDAGLLRRGQLSRVPSVL